MLWLVLSGVVSMSSAQAPAKAPGLAGTRWKFSSSSNPEGTVVTFRNDGVTVFNDSKTTGRWEQTGDTVVFDINDFTQYRVEVHGDEMKGEWVRLRGEQKGTKSPTRLKKL